MGATPLAIAIDSLEHECRKSCRDDTDDGAWVFTQEPECRLTCPFANQVRAALAPDVRAEAVAVAAQAFVDHARADAAPRLTLDDSYVPTPRPPGALPALAPQGWRWRLVCNACGAVRHPSPTGPECVVCELRKGANG
jgi:hypothetical protein